MMKPPEPEFVKPAWYLECRLHGHNADSVNVREAGGHDIQCRIFRCLECARHETVEPTPVAAKEPEPRDPVSRTSEDGSK